MKLVKAKEKVSKIDIFLVGLNEIEQYILFAYLFCMLGFFPLFYKEQYYNEETDRYYDPRRGYFDIEVERGARLRFAAAWLAHANGNKNATVMPRMFASVYSVDFEQELMYANYPNTNMQVMDGEIDVDGILRFHSELHSNSSLGPRCVALSLRYII